MPDTTGNVANLAEYRGQTLTLDPADQKTYTKLHFFGTTADGTGRAATYTLQLRRRARTRPSSVTFPDWCGSVTPPAHIAIGPLSGRYTPTGSDGARCSIYHVAVDNPAPTRKLVSVHAAAATPTPAGNARSYLMALTLEDAQGDFEMPDLTGINPFPNDNTAPRDRVDDRRRRPRPSGWYTTTPRITITGTDAAGRLRRRADPVPDQRRHAAAVLRPVRPDAEGEITLEFRAVDRAGNAETFDGVDLKVDPNAPTTTATTYPGERARGRLARP